MMMPATAASAQANDESRRSVSIRPSIQLAYDSNIYKVSRSSTLVAGPLADDISVSPGVALDISLPLGRQRVFLAGYAGYDFYLKNDRLNRERIGLDGGADLRVVGSCSTTLTAGYARAQGDLANGLSLFAAPNTEQRVTLSADARCGGPVGLQPAIGYTHQTVRNSNTSFVATNSTSDSYRGSLAYVRPSFGSLSLYGNYAESRYDDRVPTLPGVPANLREGIKSYGVGLQYSREIGARLRGSISGGYNWVDPKLGGEKFRGANYALSLDYSASERLAVGITAARSADLPNLLNVLYSITDTFGMTASYRLNPRISLNAGGSYQKRRLRASEVLVGSPFVATRDELLQLTAGAGYDLGQKLRLNLGFTHQQRRSDNDFFRYNANQVVIGASYQL
jgi:hypothetical protein